MYGSVGLYVRGRRSMYGCVTRWPVARVFPPVPLKIESFRP